MVPSYSEWSVYRPTLTSDSLSSNVLTVLLRFRCIRCFDCTFLIYHVRTTTIWSVQMSTKKITLMMSVGDCDTRKAFCPFTYKSSYPSKARGTAVRRKKTEVVLRLVCYRFIWDCCWWYRALEFGGRWPRSNRGLPCQKERPCLVSTVRCVVWKVGRAKDESDQVATNSIVGEYAISLVFFGQGIKQWQREIHLSLALKEILVACVSAGAWNCCILILTLLYNCILSLTLGTWNINSNCLKSCG